MTETKNLSPEILLHIAQTLNVPMRGLVAVIELLDDGGTVPFIARYRKEATGNLDEVQIRDIEEKLAYFRDLVDRRETILASIAEQGKLTDELKARIEATLDKSELEDLYLPYKPKRRTKATIAREKGLEPLAALSLGAADRRASRSTHSPRLSSMRKRAWPRWTRRSKARATSSPRWISEDADLRKALRQLMFDEGVVVSRKVDRRRRRAGKVQDVLRVPRAGEDDSLASHAGHSPRRERKRPLLPDRSWTRSAPSRTLQPRSPAPARRLDAAARTRHRRLRGSAC